jgi:hypothetical protein
MVAEFSFPAPVPASAAPAAPWRIDASVPVPCPISARSRQWIKCTVLARPQTRRLAPVAMMPDVMDALATLKEREHFVDDGDLVFCSEVGDHLDHFALPRRFYPALEKAGCGGSGSTIYATPSARRRSRNSTPSPSRVTWATLTTRPRSATCTTSRAARTRRRWPRRSAALIRRRTPRPLGRVTRRPRSDPPASDRRARPVTFRPLSCHDVSAYLILIGLLAEPAAVARNLWSVGVGGSLLAEARAVLHSTTPALPGRRRPRRRRGAGPPAPLRRQLLSGRNAGR